MVNTIYSISLIKMTPLNKGETRIEEILLVAPSVNGGSNWSSEEEKPHETNHNLVNKILTENWVLGETIQANMEGGAVKYVHFGRFESALICFHEQYDKVLLNAQIIRQPTLET